MDMAEFERKYRNDPIVRDSYIKLWQSLNMVNEFLLELGVPERFGLELSGAATKVKLKKEYARSRCCAENRVLKKTNITLLGCRSRPTPGGGHLVTIGSVVVAIPLCEKHYRQLPKGSQGMKLPFSKPA
jgi:hypothetical protein